MVDEQPAERLTPESAKALADKVIESASVTIIPKKIPDVDDIEAQTNVLIGALSSAFMTATELPLIIPPAQVGDVARQLVAYGIRQTDRIDPDARYAPSWITDGVRQQSVKVPEQPKHTEARPVVEMTATAPEPPKRIPNHARAVRK